MTKNFRRGTVDFDDIFEPDIMGDGPSASFLTSGDVPLKYAALVHGTKAADVGFRTAAGVDVSNLWAAKGTAVYVLSIDGQNIACNDVALTNEQSIFAQIDFTLSSAGTWKVERTEGGESTVLVASGTWLSDAAAAGDYEVQFDVTHVAGEPPAVTNGAPVYAAASTTRTVRTKLGPLSGGGHTEQDSQDEVRIRIKRVSTGLVVSDSTFTALLALVPFA